MLSDLHAEIAKVVERLNFCIGISSLINPYRLLRQNVALICTVVIAYGYIRIAEHVAYSSTNIAINISIFKALEFGFKATDNRNIFAHFGVCGCHRIFRGEIIFT